MDSDAEGNNALIAAYQRNIVTWEKTDLQGILILRRMIDALKLENAILQLKTGTILHEEIAKKENQLAEFVDKTERMVAERETKKLELET